MFSPSQQEVRSFFIEVNQKRKQALPLTPLQTMAADWVEAHPEYAADLSSSEAASETSPSNSTVRENPFLHLSMHLSISEQLQIDQPFGIRQAVDTLTVRLGSMHAAQHEVMECLGRVLWESQRNGQPLDGVAYIDCVQRKATR